MNRNDIELRIETPHHDLQNQYFLLLGTEEQWLIMSLPMVIFVYRYLPIDEKIIPLCVLCASVVNT